MIDVLAIDAWLQARLPDFLADLRSLVQVDCGTANKAGVDTVGRLACDRLAAIGCELRRFPLEQYGDCWLATLRGTGTARILLSGHLDTVYPDGTVAARPLRQEGRRLLGPGVSDMKGGLLAGCYALWALQAAGFHDYERLDFFLNSDEEIGSPASQHLYREIAAPAGAALVLEAGRANGDIVSARKGSGAYRVTVHGKQAHAGVEPERGANAIVELARFIGEATALNGLHPGTTVNAGVIGGGTRRNVVPDLAWVDLDVRFLTPEAGQALERELHAAGARRRVPSTTIEWAGGVEHPPMPKTPATAALLELVHGVAGRLGVTFRDMLAGGASDGNNFAALGVPTLDGLGPVGGLDHSPGEYLELDSIVPRTALLAGLIAAIAGRENSHD